MARSRFGHWPLLLGAVIGLAGCEQIAAGRDGAEPLPAQARGQRVTERDVQAPELFEANENGLWDGRPSLGGVWVAHPNVTDPQRVMIRNAVTGKTIIGALFRRERANPGPRFQLSSDAAEELGILAGQPTMLNVVALKREPVVEPAAEMPISEEAPAAATAGAAPAAGAAAAAAATAGSGTATAGPAAAGAEPQPVPEDAPPTSFGRRRPPPAAAPEPAAAAGAAAPSAAAAAPATAAAPSAAVPAEPEPVPEAAPPTSFGRRAAPAAAATAGSAMGEISTAPLDGAAPASPAAAAAPAAAPLDRPYIQAAIFAAESGANSVAERLRAAGLTASVRRTDVSGTVYWRVIAGPAANAAERAELLGKVKELGYSDAYPVRG